LATIPALRGSLEVTKPRSLFDETFRSALLAIVNKSNPSAVHTFFELIKDFNGRNNRYGQIAVPDFLEYLSTKLQVFFDHVWPSSISKLQCMECNWVSFPESHEAVFKLYIPPYRPGKTTLDSLLDYNLTTTLAEPAVFCGHCGVKTRQKISREQLPDTICFEIIRVTEKKSPHLGWVKSSVPICFRLEGIHIPGSRNTYRIISTAHHVGSISSGHWITKFCCGNNRWYEADDLNTGHRKVLPPGTKDTSVVMLVLIAEHLLG
jgi:ubiquitin C-terminal hydrolase